MTVTQLRANIYRILDQVIETGETVEVERNGHLIQISAASPRQSVFDRIKPLKDAIIGDPEDLVHIEWPCNLDLHNLFDDDLP